MKKRSINSNLIRNTLRQYISEQDMPVKDEMVEKKPRCLTTNSLPLTDNVLPLNVSPDSPFNVFVVPVAVTT